ncbi:hypothetical protein B9479_006369 [Cryptococcus floricola]|uniref:Uncharacterized protein n=1 Tax=Cryptococcus floricola TaxID=2591691 RepID=A0A5D3AQF5_9TREE|nr:hypothetical protein B9479_006369 [Cryptococcus floricola]
MSASLEHQLGPPPTYASSFDIDTALRGQDEVDAVSALFSDRRFLRITIRYFGDARDNEHAEPATVKAHASLLDRLLEYNGNISSDESREGDSRLHTEGGFLSLFDARVRQDDGRDKTYRQSTHYAQFINWLSWNKKLFGKDPQGIVGSGEGIIKPDGGISASVVCKFDPIDDKPTLVNSSESVMELNKDLTFLDRVTAGLHTQYHLKDNEVLYHIVGIVIEMKPPNIHETLLIGQTSCYAGGYHDACGTSYGYAGHGPMAYRLLVLDNAIVFEGTFSDGVQVVGDFDTLEKKLKDGSVRLGRSLLVQNSEGRRDLDVELVKDVRKLFCAAIEQLEAIPRDGQPLKRLPSPEGETWTTLRDMVKTFTVENAVTRPERLFGEARLSKKQVAEFKESREREEISASAGNAESGARAEDSEVVAPLPEGAESTEMNADAQPGDPRNPKRKRRNPKQQSVNDRLPKDQRDPSPSSSGGGGQGPVARRSGRIRDATTSAATKEGGQRGSGSGRGAKTAGRTVGKRVGNVGESNGNMTHGLKGRDSLKSASSKEEVRTPHGSIFIDPVIIGTDGDYDVVTTECDPLTAFNLQSIGSYMPESNASEKVRSLHESMLMDSVMDGGQTHHNALTGLRNIEEVPRQTASGIMEDDIIDDEDNGSLDRAPSAVYEDPCEENFFGDAEKRRAFNVKIQLLAARSVLRQAKTTFVVAGKEIFNKCLDEATK